MQVFFLEEGSRIHPLVNVFSVPEQGQTLAFKCFGGFFVRFFSGPTTVCKALEGLLEDIVRVVVQ